jgi:hypothetical protein
LRHDDKDDQQWISYDCVWKGNSVCGYAAGGVVVDQACLSDILNRFSRLCAFWCRLVLKRIFFPILFSRVLASRSFVSFPRTSHIPQHMNCAKRCRRKDLKGCPPHSSLCNKEGPPFDSIEVMMLFLIRTLFCTTTLQVIDPPFHSHP